MLQFYLEDTWTDDGEADDIIEYANKMNIRITVLSPSELYKMSSNEFFSGIYFCNTDIVQYHMNNTNNIHLVPDTYENVYEKYYMRFIEKMTFSEYIKKYNGTKRFIKPATNNKDFDGRVITNIDEFTEYHISMPRSEQLIYTSEPLQILSEIRLLIGDNKLYGHGHIFEKNMN